MGQFWHRASARRLGITLGRCYHPEIIWESELRYRTESGPLCSLGGHSRSDICPTFKPHLGNRKYEPRARAYRQVYSGVARYGYGQGHLMLRRAVRRASASRPRIGSIVYFGFCRTAY